MPLRSIPPDIAPHGMNICKKTLDFYHLLPSHPPHLFHLHIWPAPSPLPRTAAPAPPPLLRSAASSAWRARRVGPSSRPGRWMEQGRRSSRGDAPARGLAVGAGVAEGGTAPRAAALGRCRWREERRAVCGSPTSSLSIPSRI